jgi:hypothetical protein
MEDYSCRTLTLTLTHKHHTHGHTQIKSNHPKEMIRTAEGSLKGTRSMAGLARVILLVLACGLLQLSLVNSIFLEIPHHSTRVIMLCLARIVRLILSRVVLLSPSQCLGQNLDEEDAANFIITSRSARELGYDPKKEKNIQVAVCVVVLLYSEIKPEHIDIMPGF